MDRTAKALTAQARQLRRAILTAAYRSGGAHLGGALSAADILTVLYHGFLRYDAQRPQWPARDRFILSKGHAALALYCVLAERGIIPAEEPLRLGQAGAMLGAHPEYDPAHGIEATTGSLGHGLSLGCGLALGARRESAAWRTVVLLGDGECQEGAVWEAAMFATQHRLDNLVAIVDANGLQAIQPVREVADPEPVAARWVAFGWGVAECDGHDVAALAATLAHVPLLPGRPSVIIARTRKGRGISFMENESLWHYRCPSADEYARALQELEQGA